MISDEILRRLNALKQAAQDFTQMCNLVDGNFENKVVEIKNLELRRDKLREECDAAQTKANAIMQTASEESSKMTKDANRLLDEAKNAKLVAAEEQRRAQQTTAEAQAQMKQAVERQKTADDQYRLVEAKKKKLQEAMKS